MLYKHVVRPILFLLPGETIHNLISRFMEFFARIPGISHAVALITRVKNPRLSQVIDGVDFPLPIGLSAGFDKNGEFLSFTYMMGFGFSEIGSVTGQSYSGNTGPHIRRLVHSRSLVVNYGLASQGVDKIISRLSKRKAKFPLGISVAKSNLPAYFGEKAIDDYCYVFRKTYPYADYLTINISCPNTFDGTPFTDPIKCDRLIQKIAQEREQQPQKKPIYVKVNPDIDRPTLSAIVDIVSKYRLEGFVIGNLVKNKKLGRTLLRSPEEYSAEWAGGLSGEPTQNLSLDCIKFVFNKTRGEKTIIGCGGIFNGDDAYKKIKAGANLCQLITGFIFEGPLLIRQINKRLVFLLSRDGYKSISEAVGVEAQKGIL